ncbi:uncharacterized protein MYCFIDRAFT_77299 [Pseudocercospora fijiensis CIRAD86]|uniref:Uncharacterized protein n=1 Tax=Pseudocercospora fijiensis (strain CIRAD86) TaxID=383855 RepID=M2ZAQ4_PSEFD|nr:uncharacterized protein MYCFIDRAFT_77299 [Pseudocercospora fijiensis CIRAD86]EME86905.1 hypothetical protein MYCFIDRAFT_77299 [Pseudocercospora fijiensis CIRAD86]
MFVNCPVHGPQGHDNRPQLQSGGQDEAASGGSRQQSGGFPQQFCGRGQAASGGSQQPSGGFSQQFCGPVGFKARGGRGGGRGGFQSRGGHQGHNSLDERERELKLRREEIEMRRDELEIREREMELRLKTAHELVLGHLSGTAPTPTPTSTPPYQQQGKRKFDGDDSYGHQQPYKKKWNKNVATDKLSNAAHQHVQGQQQQQLQPQRPQPQQPQQRPPRWKRRLDRQQRWQQHWQQPQTGPVDGEGDMSMHGDHESTPGHAMAPPASMGPLPTPASSGQQGPGNGGGAFANMALPVGSVGAAQGGGVHQLRDQLRGGRPGEDGDGTTTVAPETGIVESAVVARSRDPVDKQLDEDPMRK